MDESLDIAVVGLACRFPGAANATEFWRNLAAGVDSITHFSEDELRDEGVPASTLAAANYVRAAPLLAEPAGFDAAFFGYHPSEARMMDPQHRILLELAHAALEDAGCDPARFAGRVGVYAGAAMNTYFTAAHLDRNFAQDYIPTLIVNDKDFLATRLSYKLNLRGPSITVQTACSTSLVAIHLARQSLLCEETDLALAGAISVRVPHRAGYFADAGGVTSPDGRVRAFDAAANGTVFGSGGGVLVLKRLRDALAEGDEIRAIIRGAAVNNDGAEKAGYTAPSVNGQADAVIEALANAAVSAGEISYLEAHGSGTPVGDPIELRALTKAFRASTARRGFCALGSVKTNVGHLDVAAGLAGIIKTILALQHRQLPASLHYTQPNPEIDFPATPFFVNPRLAEWPSGEGPRRAGVLSTGMGGTNACVILEEAPALPAARPSGEPNLLVLSARSGPALAAAASHLGAFLQAHPAASLDDAAFTLQTGRAAMPHRRFVVANTAAEASAALVAKPSRTGAASLEANHQPRTTVLLLPGVGDQYVGMGQGLDAAFPVFRDEIDRCAAIVQPLLGIDLREVLYPAGRAWRAPAEKKGIDLRKMLEGNASPPEDQDARCLNDPLHVQPALFAIEYALARLWESFGIVPHAYAGHSMGEYVAACLAGVFSLEDALRLLVCRTRLVSRLPAAGLLAVSLPEAELQALLPAEVSIALLNAPGLCVVAGPPAALEPLAQSLTAQGILVRPVRNTHAFHSKLLEPVAEEFAAEVHKVRLSSPRLPFISNVTGTWISAAEAVDSGYWARHLHCPARFSDAVAALWQLENPLLLEAGPGKTLGVLAMQHPARRDSSGAVAISSLRHHYENQSDVELLLHSAGQLWLAGVDLRWSALHRGEPRRKVSLPTYPFQRESYWFEPVGEVRLAIGAGSEAPVSRGIDSWFYSPSWQRRGFPAPLPREHGAGSKWLILGGSPSVAMRFQECLRTLGAVVEALGTAAECREFFARAENRELAALRIICLAALSLESEDTFDPFTLAQALSDAGIALPVTVGLLTDQLHEVTGQEQLKPVSAVSAGLCGVFSKEYPNVTCFNLDLPTTDFDAALIPIVLAEFIAPAAGAVVAYRGRHRWVRTFEPLVLPAAPPRPKRLRHRGVYLITGGTGGLGREVAGYLARTCQARLLLLQRTAFPERARWPELQAAQSAPREILEAIEQFIHWEKLGAQVEVIAADVCEAGQMSAALRAGRQKFGELHGVFHAAGVVRAGLMQAASRESAERVLAPKVGGTLVLDHLLRDVPLDFLLLFSSLAAVTTPFAHAEYSAANAFLDAFAAHSNCMRPYFTVALAWPVWREAGTMAKLKAAAGVENLREAALEHGISTAEGLEVLARVLDAATVPQVIVSPEPLASALSRAEAEAGALTERPASWSVEVAGAPGGEVEAQVAAIWREVFGIAAIGLDENFAALGGHSLLALRILTKVRAHYEVDLTLRDFFSAPSIARLAGLIDGKLRQEIDGLSDEEVAALLALP